MMEGSSDFNTERRAGRCVVIRGLSPIRILTRCDIHQHGPDIVMKGVILVNRFKSNKMGRDAGTGSV
jgi:hypothetical protein